ncbi:glycoside hydrolase family 88/105 protein [Lapidilactobacillus wuchangensis]|uniref:glycoside hydrolase family 88/105 protein n=1 Tax=Lapidilactobacillus wuchangensis TaxID=2486001 RepID=UPI000F7B64BA|nr:glycoside hydrolase family 88 protein [Lapidilactobacillus wuchangensis]
MDEGQSKLIKLKTTKMFEYLINLKDSTGEFTYQTAVGLVDDKSWNSWNWPQGVALYGLAKIYQSTKNVEILTIIKKWFNDNYHYPIPARELNVNGMIPILTLATLKDEMSNEIPNLDDYLQEWAEWAMTKLRKTPFGGFEHDTFGSINKNQLWDDTLVMAVLPLAKIGMVLDRSQYVSAAMNQFVIHSKFLMERDTGLWYHGWSFDQKSHFSPVFWGRGNAWISIFIPEFLEIAGNQLNEFERQYLRDTLKYQIQALLPLQTQNGFWRTVLDDETSYEETSATAGFLYGMLMARKLRIIQGSALNKSIDMAVTGLLHQVKENGQLGNVSSGTPVGNNIQFYKDIAITDMPYGQALAILALSQFQ